MTDDRRLEFAEQGEAADLVVFLKRQLRWDKAAAVRVQAGGTVAALFTRPARFEVLAVRPCRLRTPTDTDVTVAAGELLDSVDEANEAVRVPAPITGPSWAGVLPPRGGWRSRHELQPDTLRAAAAEVVAEFRSRTERLPVAERTRSALDALAEDVWSRTLSGTPVPLRAVHAAHALGLLRGDGSVAVLTAGPWLRLRTGLGSIVVRGTGVTGLSVTPV